MIKEISINTPFIKLDSFLKFSGEVTTGGNAKEFISDSLVKVNGEVCTMRGKKLVVGDQVEINGVTLKVVAE